MARGKDTLESKEMEAFIRSLPDPEGARTFLHRLQSLPSAVAAIGSKTPLFLARLLTIAAYSPYLSEELLRHPEYVAWLKRETEGDLGRGKSVDQLSEELARFTVRAVDTDHAALLARFKRREFLRIYLRDCLGVATLAEVTHELSDLADVILKDAFSRAWQEMANRHGAPLVRDERGRIGQAELAVVALGKLGCFELNYASDIDLLFLYEGDGETAGDGRRPESVVPNKQFFIGVAQRIVQMIGSKSGEGAVYRIDLRLRPYGRDGDLVWEIERAAGYYRNKAQSWERQALIRARAAAGNEAVVSRFLDLVHDWVFQPEALQDSIADVRRAKEKIDREAATRSGGFNVKLGRGGIREIEFIAQALQLAYGASEPWLRTMQTLIVLARLAEKGLLSESERTKLSAAYTFFRTVEHRLQMEHGVQTHTLPLAPEKLALVALRCGYATHANRAGAFQRDLEAHAARVRAVYTRVFSERPQAPAPDSTGLRSESDPAPAAGALGEETDRLLSQAAIALERLRLVHRHGKRSEPALNRSTAKRLIGSALSLALNSQRSLRNLIAWANSLATYEQGQVREVADSIAGTRSASLIGPLLATLSSQYLSHILLSRPTLASILTSPEKARTKADLARLMRKEIDQSGGPASRSDALRRAWYRIVLAIGYRDISSRGAAGDKQGAEGNKAEGISALGPAEGQTRDSLSSVPPGPCSPARFSPVEGSIALEQLRANNLEQTALAEAALELAVEIAMTSVGVQPAVATRLPFALLGLGRLGHAGMDYGSDLDLLMVFDDDQAWPPEQLSVPSQGSPQEFYAKLGSEIVRVLSQVTREGYLYRVDLRLRPDGKSGPLACGFNSLLRYLSRRASPWEHSAYLKAREVAGSVHFGARASAAIRQAIFKSAAPDAVIKDDLRSIRARLEKEKARGNRGNIKWGPGGITDVYFVTRYLQLRDRIHFPPEKGTAALIAHLSERGSLDAESAQVLFDGYVFLRRLDHWMRLLLDYPSPVLPSSSAALRDTAVSLGLPSAEELERQYSRHASNIRQVFKAILE